VTQLALVSGAVAPPLPTIDLRCCDVVDVLAEVRDAGMVHTDSPWVYQNNGGRRGFKAAESHYTCLRMGDILAHHDAAYDCAAPDTYMVVWCTWPVSAEWMDIHRRMRWRFLTGGSWTKPGRIGIGFHVRGNSEPWFLYAKGKPRPRKALRNEYVGAATKHSAKPVPYLRRMLGAFSDPGVRVLELYAGLGSMARACLAEGRAYVGAEVDPTRHAEAMALLRQGAR
jgi:hypothetical protein